MASLYILIILFFRVVQAFFNKRTSDEICNATMLIGYNAFKHSLSALLGIGLILITGNGFRLNGLTVLLAAFSGLSLFAGSFCSIYAMKSGTIALNSMFGTAGMIIPIVASIFLFDKAVNPMQAAGLVLFLFAAYLLINASKQVYTNFNFKTLLLLMGSMIANGCTMLAQQMFTAYVPKGDVSVFSALSFGIIAVASGVFFHVLTPYDRKISSKPNKLSKSLLLCGIALAIAVFVINQLATISTALLSPIVLFTFINGGGTMISTLVAAIVYKEKITVKTGVGIVLGVISLVTIKIFQ